MYIHRFYSGVDCICLDLSCTGGELTETLRNTLYTIAVISVSAGVFDIFFHSAKLRNYTKYVVSLIITAAILSPIPGVIKEMDGDIKNHISLPEESKADAYKEFEAALETAIKSDLCNRLKYPENALSVKVFISHTNEEITVNTVKVTLTDKNYFRFAERTEAYLKSNYGCNIEVIQSFKE